MKYKNIEIGIVCALKEEFEQLSEHVKLSSFEIERGFECAFGTLNNKTVVIVKCGIGIIKSAMATTFLLERYNPSTLFFSGIAGALDPTLNIGDVVIGNSVFQAEAITHSLFADNWTPDPLDIHSSPDLLEIAQGATKVTEFKIMYGTIVSSEVFPAPQSFKQLFEEKKAVAIDMESAAFSKVCQAYKKYFLVIRGISNPVVSTDDGKIDKNAIINAVKNAANITLSIINLITLNFVDKFINADKKKYTNEQVKILTQKYELLNHPEGGFFQQIHKSKDVIKPPQRFKAEERSSSTSIYYLLAFEDFSAFHRIKSDETWYFHQGSNLLIHMIDPRKRKLSTIILGNPIESEKAVNQFTVQAEFWFSAELQDKNSYAFVSCAVSPGFEYEDFELASRRALSFQFDEYSEIIERLTRIEQKNENINSNSKDEEEIEEKASTFSKEINSLN